MASLDSKSAENKTSQLLLEIIKKDIDNYQKGNFKDIKKSGIYYLYDQVIEKPYINTIYDIETSFYFNIILWYFILQIGVIQHQLGFNFVVKGGFVIQFMIDSDYPTSDIDIKVKSREHALSLQNLLLKLIPKNIPIYIPTEKQTKPIPTEKQTTPIYISTKEEENEVIKFSIMTKNGFVPFMDIEFSKPPHNTAKFFNDIERHTRRAKIYTSNTFNLNQNPNIYYSDFEFNYLFYTFESQYNEKVFLYNKYKNKLFHEIKTKLIDKLRSISESIELSKKNDSHINDLMGAIIEVYSKLPTKVLSLISNAAIRKTTIDVFTQKVEKRGIRFLFKLKMPLNVDEKLLLIDSLEPIVDFFRMEVVFSDTETIPMLTLFFLLSKFTKSHEHLSKNNSRNKWNVRNNNMIQHSLKKHRENITKRQQRTREEFASRLKQAKKKAEEEKQAKKKAEEEEKEEKKKAEEEEKKQRKKAKKKAEEEEKKAKNKAEEEEKKAKNKAEEEEKKAKNNQYYNAQGHNNSQGTNIGQGNELINGNGDKFYNTNNKIFNNIRKKIENNVKKYTIKNK
jgi:hypothetical protein